MGHREGVTCPRSHSRETVEPELEVPEPKLPTIRPPCPGTGSCDTDGALRAGEPQESDRPACVCAQLLSHV